MLFHQVETSLVSSGNLLQITLEYTWDMRIIRRRSMQRADTERIFALVAEIGGDIRGRIISERWWLVWIVMGVQILITTSITQLLLWGGESLPLVYFGLWGLHILFIPPIIFFIHRRSGGQRTATEMYIWWIWATFILTAASIGLLNQAVGLPLFF